MILDVALLYGIITSAEQHPNVETLPFRALFAAYDDVLAQHGINPSHDQVYLRFLFRLGDKKRPENSLYDCFEALLAQCGIRIEFESNEGGAQEASARQDDAEGLEHRDPGAAAAEGSAPTAGRSRRASFESFYDVNEDSIRPIGLLPRSQAPTSLSQLRGSSVPEQRPSTRATTRPTEKTQKQSSHNQSIAAWTDKERLTAKQFASRFPLHRPSSTINQDLASTKEPAFAAQSTQLRLSSPAKGSDAASAFSSTHVRNPDTDHVAYPVSRDALLYRPSETQLMRDVHTFQCYRVRHVARVALQKWTASAYRARAHNKSLEQQATLYDLETLLRQGFQQWRTNLHQKRKAIETKRFFENLGRRASKARDIYLLTKAFTHWARSSSDYVMQTSSVRRHLLGLKYFNAWHEITVVNELKVRQHQLSKYLRNWQQNHARIGNSEAEAAVLYDGSLVKSAYWCWFWTFCDRRAPEWRAAKLKKRIFLRWTSRQQQLARKSQLVHSFRTETIARWSFSKWLASTRAMRSRLHEAEAFGRRRCLAHAVSTWKFQRYHAPRMQRLSNMVDWRVAGTTFAIVVTRYRAGRQAEVVDRLRVMRNAWTIWNDALRQNYLLKRIDDRIVIEQLYRWALAQRCGLVRRSRERRLKARFLSKLATALLERRQRRVVARQNFEAKARQSRTKMVTSQWSSRLTTIRQHESVAFRFHAPRVAQEVLQTWSVETAHIQRLQTEAKKAAFYLSATKFIKVWQAALSESKRLKRRNGYIQIRKIIKMNLAAKVLRRWQDLAIEQRNLYEQAQSSDHTRLLRFASSLFDQWRSEASLAYAHDGRASQHHSTILAGQHLQRWSDRFRTYWRMEDLARLNDEVRISSVAFNWLHKLRLRAIEVRGREANAQSLRSFYERRHVQGLLRLWRDSAVDERRRTTHKSVGARSRLPNMSFDDDRLGQAPLVRARGSTHFEQDFGSSEWIHVSDANAGTTLFPGYLSTPAKRASRARELQEATSTTPVGTPFPYRLPRALHSQRRAEAKDLNNQGGRMFSVILEASPRTPGAG